MDDEAVNETLKIFVAQIIEVIKNAYPDNKYDRDWCARGVCQDILDDLDVEGFCGCRLCGS